jgi:hypothetical protein
MGWKNGSAQRWMIPCHFAILGAAVLGITGVGWGGNPDLTIYLKGGAGTIRAERVWQQSDQICWESRGYQGCIPKSQVSIAPVSRPRSSSAPKAIPTRSTGPVVSQEPDDFCGNPYQHTGQDIVLRGLQLRKAFDAGSATFGTRGNREILVSGLPTDRQYTPGEWYDFVVRSLGVSEGKNAYGGPVTTPHALFVGLP